MALQESYRTQAEIPENVRSDYVEKDGIWVLGLLAKYVAKTKLDEFRTNNRTLIKDKEALQTQLLKFKNVDPEKYQEAVTKLQELENDRLAEAGEWKVLKANLEQSHTDTLKTEKAKAKAIQDGWNKEKIANQTAMIVLKHAIPEEGNMKYVQADVQGIASIDPETSEIVFLNKEGLKIKNEAGDKDLNLEEYLTKTYIPKSNLFRKSQGGGALGAIDIPMVSQGQVKVDNISGKDISSKMIEDLASGKISAVD